MQMLNGPRIGRTLLTRMIGRTLGLISISMQPTLSHDPLVDIVPRSMILRLHELSSILHQQT